jgi:hypothetical protein
VDKLQEKPTDGYPSAFAEKPICLLVKADSLASRGTSDRLSAPEIAEKQIARGVAQLGLERSPRRQVAGLEGETGIG